MRAARCLGVRTRRRDRKSARNAWILALRKSRLVVETDLAGRKKRGGKCAGKGYSRCRAHVCGEGKKMGTRSVCAEHTAGPVCSSSKTMGDEVAVQSLFLFPPFLFSFLSFLSPFFSFSIYA